MFKETNREIELDIDIKPRWKITIVIPFLPGENITTPTVSKGKNFTPRGITSHYP